MANRGLTFARGQGSYPRTRIVVCLLVLAATWAVLRPVSAAVATLVVVLSFSMKTSCAVDVLAWFLIAGGAAAGAVSWPVAAVLALFPLLIVPVVLVAGDIVHKIVLPESADPLGRLAMGRIVRIWARVGVPWAALLAIVFLGGWRDAVLLLIPVALLSAGRFVIAGIWCVALWFIHGSDLATLAVAVLAASGALAPVLARRPSRHLPLPAPQLRDGPRLALRLWRVDLALRRNDGYRAQRILDTESAPATGPARSALRVRAALCALDDGRYQDASDAVGPAEAAPAYDRVLTWLRSEVLAAMNRSAEAVDLLRALLADPSLLSRNERVCYGLTLAQALGRAGRYAAATKAAQAVLAGQDSAGGLWNGPRHTGSPPKRNWRKATARKRSPRFGARNTPCSATGGCNTCGKRAGTRPGSAGSPLARGEGFSPRPCGRRSPSGPSAPRCRARRGMTRTRWRTWKGSTTFSPRRANGRSWRTCSWRRRASFSAATMVSRRPRNICCGRCANWTATGTRCVPRATARPGRSACTTRWRGRSRSPCSPAMPVCKLNSWSLAGCRPCRTSRQPGRRAIRWPWLSRR